MSKYLLTICIALSAFLGTYRNGYAQPETLDVYFKIVTPGSDYKDAKVTVIKKGQTNQTFNPPKRRVSLNLSFDEEYVLRFELEGCVKKEININTKNVPRHMTYELLEVAFEVELSKSSYLNDEAYLNSEKVNWHYDEEYGMFDYSVDNFPAGHLEAKGKETTSLSAIPRLPLNQTAAD